MSDETREEKDWRLRLQEFFDLRYVLKEDAKLVRSLVYGLVALILTGAITALMGILYDKIK